MKKIAVFPLLTLLLASTAGKACAEAEFEFKSSSQQVTTHPVMAKGFLPLLDLVKEKTGGRISITYYNPNTLMPTKALLDGLRKGLIDIASFQPTQELARFPASEVIEMPMLFDSALASSLSYLELTRTNPYLKKEWSFLRPVTVTTSVPQDILSKKPIRTLEDLKGLRIAAVSSPGLEQIKLLGGIPVLLQLTDMYLSLQRGMVDAVMAPIPTYKSSKVCEVAKYLTKCNLGVMSSPFGFSMKSYNRLPADLKKSWDDIFENEGPTLFRASWIDRSATEDLEYIKKNNGVEVIELSQAERVRWIKALEPTYEEFIGKMKDRNIDGESLLNECRALNKKYSDPAVISELFATYKAKYPNLEFGM